LKVGLIIFKTIQIIKMKKIFFLFLLINQALLAQKSLKDAESVAVSNPANNALSPRLTTDHKGNPVLSWAEQNDSSEVIAVCFATSKDGGLTFSDKKNVRIIKGVTAHAEGMPKVAFKSDGTIVAIFETKRPVPDSRFSGDLLYTMSSDSGDNWAVPQYVHADTSAGKSRSFSDLQRLPNGEIGVTWLGERGGKGGGRPVKFAQTTKGQGFSGEITAKEGACECCRTNLFVDTEGVLHIFFRDILEDGTRDMGHVLSTNQGQSFGNYKLVYADKWKINGCPHTGPSTAQLNKTLYTAWYTGDEKNIGVKITDNEGKILTHIKSANAKHPQLIANNNKLILAWDEPIDNNKGSQIKVRILDKKNAIKSFAISSTKETATYPYLLATNKHLIVAYEAGDDKKQIYFKSVLWTTANF
jgi:hypothetical protein